VLSGINGRNEEILKARNNTLLVVQSLAAQQQHIATGTRMMLSTLALLPEVQRLDANACSEIFRELHNRNPFYYVIHAETPDGKVFAASAPFPPDSVNLSDRKHINDAIRTLDFSPGEYIVGRVVTAPSINYAFPVLDSNRNLVAILTAGFKLDEYARFISNANLAQDYSVTFTDHKGVRLYRWPENEATAPGKLLPSDSFQLISGDSIHGIFEKTGQDGIDRVYAFRQLRLNENSSPYLYMTVGIAKDKILQKARLKMLRNLSFLGVAVLMAVFLAWCFGHVALIKPTNRLADAALRLGKGEMGTRTGLPHTPDELGRVAKSFDEMASLLEVRNIERKNAEDALSEANSELEMRVKTRTAELSEANAALSLEISERKGAEEERRRLEDRLQRAEKMEALGTLAGGVAHDLNNVLGIVVGYSELLVNDSGESSSARSKAMEILKGGQRAAAIVQDLLTLARRGVSNRKVLNLNNIVLECRNSPELAGISAYHPNVRLKTDLGAHLLNISGSAVHLGKSLINLITNAAEAMPQGGVITIKTGNQYLDRPVSGYDEVREGDYVVLSVSDTGEGIPARDMKRIFEPFYTKKVMGRSGTGLGLAVIWGTVKDHLGYINVESQEGKGTIFTLYFPVAREEISQEQVSISAAEYMGNGESILIVDDVKEQRELAGMMLKKLNYNVVSVASGEETVEYLKQNMVDLVVLDMIMDPGMDGLDTYTKILEIHPHQRAIIVSGFSETERVSRAQALGAGSYVKKPYVLEKIGLAVRKELGRPAWPAAHKIVN
jgi:signal transduction histidine kinase/CheY-like chemotaxis protein